jgi:long-chain acyl-CoA synthetase
MNTLADPLRHAARFHADRPAVTDVGAGTPTRTYAELDDRVRRLATVIAERTNLGDRVALLALNSEQYLEMYFAVPASGRLIVPLNTRWADPELIYALDDSASTLLVTDREPGELADHVGAVLPTGPALDALIDAAAPMADLGAGVVEDDVAGLFYTGGTTGQSKGVMLTHRNLIANAVHVRTTAPAAPGDAYLVMAPMFHAAGSNSVVDVVWNGAHHVILPGFDAASSLDAMERFGVNMLLAVPTMMAAQVDEQLARPRDVTALRRYLHGGSPVAGEVVRRALEAFPGVEQIELYGATELSPLVTAFNHHEQAIDTDRLRSCGRPIMGVAVRIIDGATDEELPPGAVGEIEVRGANVMAGYWNKPDVTAAVLRDGWYRTGDVGRLDADGYLFVLDRSKDMIITGGENVYSTEVEEVLYTHPGVAEATVFGIPDETWGEAVHAVVVARQEGLTATELIEHCRRSIAGYKVPKSVDFRADPLPKSGPGKVLKRELRAPYWSA